MLLSLEHALDLTRGIKDKREVQKQIDFALSESGQMAATLVTSIEILFGLFIVYIILKNIYHKKISMVKEKIIKIKKE